MGGSNSWFIDINAKDEALLKEMISKGRALESFYTCGPTWDAYCFRKWSERSKWNPLHLMLNLSEAYPDVIISVSSKGDSGTNKYFILNGECLYEEEIWKHPLFPTPALFRRALVAAKKLQAEQEAAEVKERIEKARLEKLAKIEALKKELEELEK